MEETISQHDKLVELDIAARVRMRHDVKLSLEDLAARVSVIEIEQARHMVKTQTTIDNSRELLETFNALKGAWLVLNGIGRLAKPVSFLVSLGGVGWWMKDHFKDFFK